MAYIARRHDTNVSEAPVGLPMPVSGFMKSDTLCIVQTLSNAVIQGTFMETKVNVRTKTTTSLTYGSGFTA